MYERIKMRLLWAEAIDDLHTAIVIDVDGQLLGSVVILMEYKMEMREGSWGGRDTLEMRFRLQWYQVVKSPEDFRQSSRYAEAKRKKLSPSGPHPMLQPPLLKIEDKDEG